MTHYAIVEKATGKIVRMHAHYVFGNEQAVRCTDDELQAMLSELGEPQKFEIHSVPEDFNPADRGKTLRFDPEGKHLKVVDRAPRKSQQGEG